MKVSRVRQHNPPVTFPLSLSHPLLRHPGRHHFFQTSKPRGLAGLTSPIPGDNEQLSREYHGSACTRILMRRQRHFHWWSNMAELLNEIGDRPCTYLSQDAPDVHETT